ncbi:predicted protein [Postia placenta Mad-698-R]|nr:predicted protein [Postia placenta Mad-698-R]
MPNAEMKSNIWPLRTGSRREGMPRGSIPNRERPATSVWLGAKRALGRAASSGPIVRRMRKMSRDLCARHRDDRAELRVSVAHRRRCRRASKAKSNCWETESKCRAGCECRKEVYRGPEGLGAYHRFLSQLRIYWLVNTSLTTIELKVQVALSLLDSDARTWATPIFAQLILVQLGTQGVTTLFANEAAFATMLKARFGNLDDKAVAQVELAKLCVDKSVHEKCTAAEFSALFKGPADCSGYGDLELRDKYLSGIPSCVYRKIELKMFTMWEDADKRATEVEQILDISRACQPELNSFFSARGRG